MSGWASRGRPSMSVVGAPSEVPALTAGLAAPRCASTSGQPLRSSGSAATSPWPCPVYCAQVPAATSERVNQESKRLKELFQTFGNERVWKGAFIRPVEGELSGAFGTRRIINGQPKSSHTGVDLRAEEGTPVLASNSGRVALVDDLFFSGKSVILDHGWSLYSMYFHLSEARVRVGDQIPKGAELGRVGSTGRSTGPHLHWGIILNGARVDPFSLLRSTASLQ